jgi:hypothetical protein
MRDVEGHTNTIAVLVPHSFGKLDTGVLAETLKRIQADLLEWIQANSGWSRWRSPIVDLAHAGWR